MIKLSIQPEVRNTFMPCIGVIYAYGIDNSKEISELENLFTEVSAPLKREFEGLENPNEHPTIAAWRKAYKTFGTDPQRYRSSAEALARRVLKDQPLLRINTLVDLYNYISIKYVLPVGGEDLDAIQGNFQLAFADGTEEFIVLGGIENDAPKLGEVVYKDDKGVICRSWNWREADRTKLTKETTNAVVVIDTIPPTDKDTVTQATKELAKLIQKYCGGEISSEVI